MYYPLIRGRQYDLLALRELITRDLLSKRIMPIIEPIKISPTLVSTIKCFEEREKKIIVVTNPKVGAMKEELSVEKIYIQYREMINSNAVIIGHHMNKQSETQIGANLDEFKITLGDIAIIHSDRNLIDLYKQIYKDNGLLHSPCINVVPQDSSYRRKLNGEKLVILEDKFNKLSRNADYADCEHEFFSEEHLYFSVDGYIGYSDYSIVGADYNEAGFAPYAVAIHIVFPNDENALEIMHFVSDSNEDTSDPAGKFSEALGKMITWLDERNFNEIMSTYAISVFRQHYEDGTYPGLPTLKKLSIMHHLELVGKILDRIEENTKG